MTGRRFGELTIRDGVDGTTVGVPGKGCRKLESSAEAVSAFIRQGDDGRYRPLSGARTLPRGWKVVITSSFPLAPAIEAVYPMATVHQRMLATGNLPVVPLEAVLARQSGRYESSSSLSQGRRLLAIGTLCGGCVRVPVWSDAACGPEEIPCPEPCSVMVALCREAALWETNRPASAVIDATIPFAAFEEPGNELRERYLSAMIEAQ